MGLNPRPSRCRGLRRGAFGLRCPPMLQPLQSDDRDVAALAIHNRGAEAALAIDNRGAEAAL